VQTTRMAFPNGHGMRSDTAEDQVMHHRMLYRWTLLTLLLGFVLTSPAWSATLRCTTYEEKTLNRLHTLCDDGTRAVSRYNTILERWETTITSSPRTSCTARMHPQTRQVELHSR
jgi:hypothetical protein